MILLINMRWSIMLARVFVIVMMAFVFQWSNNYTNHVVVGEYDAVWLKGFIMLKHIPILIAGRAPKLQWTSLP